MERNLYQVYRHFVAEYAFPVKGPYSAQEEKIMEICFHHCPDKAVVYLSAILSREPRNIYNRLHYIHDGKFNLLILDNAYYIVEDLFEKIFLSQENQDPQRQYIGN